MTGVEEQILVRKDKIVAVLASDRIFSLGSDRFAPISVVIVEGVEGQISVIHSVEELAPFIEDPVFVSTGEGRAVVSKRHVVQVRASGFSDATTGVPSTFVDLSSGDEIFVLETPASVSERIL
jgi:hypothetical protein